MTKINNESAVAEMDRRFEVINRISPSMCLVKWLQSTVMLHNGFTHSCHHPVQHKIPLDEIKRSPKALHNTEYKMEQRRLMLRGERPPECEYCWNIEDLPGNHRSDRAYKSADGWAFPNLANVVRSGPGADINPTYLEVAFENTCNFKCAYCSPEVSSKWMEEVKQHGPYQLSYEHNNTEWLDSVGRTPIPNREDNPYVDAFWEWWPELHKTLKTFRVTGGEPLLSKNLWRVLHYCEDNPNPDLNLAINTNLDVPDDFHQRLIQSSRNLKGKVKSLDIFTSCEATGAQAEYIRFGMHYERFMTNVKNLLWITDPTFVKVQFMITFNCLSITTFDQFLKEIWDLRDKFNDMDGINRIPIMIAYLRWPPFLSMRILPDDIKAKYSKRILDMVKSHTKYEKPTCAGRFYLEEVDQVERLIEYMNTPEPDLETHRKNFASFITQYDQRRETNFVKTFPELADFYEYCKGL